MRGPIFGIAASFVASIAFAQPSGTQGVDAAPASDALRIDWIGDTRCRPTTDIVEGLRRLLGNDRRQAPIQPIDVLAQVESMKSGWVLELSSTTPQGPMKRRLVAPTCPELAQAASLVLSLWFQSAEFPEPAPAVVDVPPMVPPRRENLESDAETNPNPRATHAQSGEDASSVVLRRKSWGQRQVRRLRLRVAIGPVGFGGALPAPAFGLMGRVGIALDAWRIDAMGLWLNSQQIWTRTPAAVGGRFGLLASGIRVARAIPLTNALNVLPGAWTIVGQLKGESLGAVAESTPSADGWGAAGVALDTELRVGRAQLSIGAGCGLPFGHPRYLVGDHELYRIPPVTWFGQIAIGTAFP